LAAGLPFRRRRSDLAARLTFRRRRSSRLARLTLKIIIVLLPLPPALGGGGPRAGLRASRSAAGRSPPVCRPCLCSLGCSGLGRAGSGSRFAFDAQPLICLTHLASLAPTLVLSPPPPRALLGCHFSCPFSCLRGVNSSRSRASGWCPCLLCHLASEPGLTFSLYALLPSTPFTSQPIRRAVCHFFFSF
jgi:hypothetical protein